MNERLFISHDAQYQMGQDLVEYITIIREQDRPFRKQWIESACYRFLETCTINGDMSI